MELMQSLLHSMTGQSANWMLLVSAFGMSLCVKLALYYVGRIAFMRSSVDVSAEACHAFMALAMAYMFAPLPALKVVPDILWAFTFSLLALAFGLRALKNIGSKNGVLADLSHSVMNLSMVYMFMQSTWDNTFVTGAFIGYFAAYATIHGVELAQSATKYSWLNETAKFANSIFSSWAQVMMALAMIALFYSR